MMLRYEAPAELAEFRQHGNDLIIGQVLKNLPDEANVAIGQRVLDYVGVLKRHICTAECRLVMRDQGLDNIDTDIPPAGRGQLLSHRIVSTPQIDYGHSRRANSVKFSEDLCDVWRNDRSIVRAIA
jgi:hypothetical protein